MVTKANLDAMSDMQLYDLPLDTPITDFDKNAWKSVWIQGVGYWWEDGSAWHDYVINGFKGWIERTDFEVYMDLRFTYISDQNKTWEELADENHELGKFS